MDIAAIKKLALEERNGPGALPAVFAPLEGNTNDKGTMFAGSIFSACILCGYRAAERAFADAGIQGETVAARADIKYRRPVGSDAVAAIHSVSALDASGTQPALDIQVNFRDADGQPCAILTARYVCVRTDRR